jgi:hypothetical protein
VSRANLGDQATGVRPPRGYPALANLQFAICNLQFAVSCVAIFAVISIATAADTVDNPDKERQRAQLLEQMRELAKATTVRYQDVDRVPKLLDSPVFRYDDQPRRFIDATIWVWTDAGRPVAFEKIEAMVQDLPKWGYCFTSVAEGLLDVRWSDGREFHSTALGIEFLPLIDAPAVPARSTTRKLEARKLVRDFSARILTDDRANTSEEMRLLPTPILEYGDAESKEFLGAVFGLTTNGTNPDLLILLEPRKSDGQPTWHYAIGRMTIGGVTLKYRDNVVWTVDFYPPRPTAFPTWTFFYTLRQEADGERAGTDSKPSAAQPKPK